MDRPEIAANIAEIRRQEMDAGPRDPRRPPGLAGLRGLRAARGRPAAAAARGLLRPRAGRGGGRAAGAADPRVPAARDHDVRRERRLPAPRPHHVPPGLRARPSRRRATPSATPTPASRGSREALLPPRLQPGERPTPCTRRCSPAASSRRTPSGWRTGTREPDVRTPESPPGCRARTTSRCATRRCSRTPPRSTPTAAGSRSRWSSSSEVWPTEDYELVRSLVDIAAARGRPVRGHRRPRLRHWSHGALHRPRR